MVAVTSMTATTLSISPARFDAVIFDLDGVVTQTALVHAAAWKHLFDDFLRQHAAETGTPFRPFDEVGDYAIIGGKPRYDGVQSFLASRGIHLPWGSPSDGAEARTVCGLGNRKNEMLREAIEIHGVRAYESTINLIRALRACGVRTAIISSSRNCTLVLESAGAAADLAAILEIDGYAGAA